MRRFGLIGKTLKHSFSKNYFTQKFRDLSLDDCAYDLFELPSVEGLPDLVSRHPSLEGLNVTIPFKEEVLGYLHHASPVVSAIEAAKCIKIAGGRLYGFNTDVVGFKLSLQPLLQRQHTRALILGWGGAARAVAFALQELGIGYSVVSRRRAANHLSYAEIDRQVLEEHKILVNTSPLGMYPEVETAPPIPYNLLTPDHFLYDLVYNPEKTEFLRRGEERGAQILNGYPMLVLQAEESWRIWNDPKATEG